MYVSLQLEDLYPPKAAQFMDTKSGTRCYFLKHISPASSMKVLMDVLL
jgi:hypothetical protein